MKWVESSQCSLYYAAGNRSGYGAMFEAALCYINLFANYA